MDINIGRCTASHSYCAFRSCPEMKDLHNIKKGVRIKILREQRFYIPADTRACLSHYESKAWNDLNNFGPMKTTYNKSQIEDMVDLLRPQKMPEDDLMEGTSSSDMKITTGLDTNQFQVLLDSIPLLKQEYKNNLPMARKALYTYLLRLRTGQTLDQIASGLYRHQKAEDC